jgi:AcrR family transcriptional regulator
VEGPVAVDRRDPADHATGAGPAPSNFTKLRSGPGQRPADVAANQRLRLRTAMSLLVFERGGFEGVTVRELSRFAGVSTATFYRHFANTEACLAFACEETTRQMVDRADRARCGGDNWRDGVRIVLRSLAEQMSQRPQDAYLITIGIHTGDPLATHATRESSKTLEHLLVKVFEDAPRSVVAPRRLVAGMAAGMLRVARTTMIAGRAAELPGVSGQLAEWMLTLPAAEILGLRMSSRAERRARPRRPAPDRDVGTHQAATFGERDRILAASRKLIKTMDPSELTPSLIRREAGVSRRAFDANFAGATEAVIKAVEEAVVDTSKKADRSAAGVARWDQQMYLRVLALCATVAKEGSVAGLAFTRLADMGRTGLLCRESLITRAATFLHESAPPAQRPDSLSAEASAAAAWQIATDEIAVSGVNGLPDAVPFVVYAALAPVVGPKTAATAGHS